MDIAALLIKYKADVNATDRWLFTPLHEAAQKGQWSGPPWTVNSFITEIVQ